jgi:hypothetical protein
MTIWCFWSLLHASKYPFEIVYCLQTSSLLHVRHKARSREMCQIDEQK